MEQLQKSTQGKKIDALPEVSQNIEANQEESVVEEASIVIELLLFPNQSSSLLPSF